MSIMSERIKSSRKAAGLTLEQVGELLGVQKSAVRKYESGLVENIPRASIQKMAEAFGVQPAWLLGLDEPADVDQDTNELLEELKNREEMRMLFSVAKGATKEDIMRAVTIIEALRKNG